MARAPGSKPNRLSAEESLLEKQRQEILREQQRLEKKLKILPAVIEAQEEQKRRKIQERAKSAGSVVSSGNRGSSRRTRGTSRTLRMPSRERFGAQIKTIALLAILALIVFMLLRQIH